MKKVSTAAAKATRKFPDHKLTIGLDLGDRSSWYCVLDEAGEVLREQKLGTTPKAMREGFGGMPRSRIALETGMHSPWVSRLLMSDLFARCKLGVLVSAGDCDRTKVSGVAPSAVGERRGRVPRSLEVILLPSERFHRIVDWILREGNYNSSQKWLAGRSRQIFPCGRAFPL